MEEKTQIVIQRIIKAQESKYLVFFFSMFVITFSYLVYHITGLLIPSFLSLVILFYILSAPQARLSYFIVEDKLVLTSLLGKKELDIGSIEEMKIIDLPIIIFPFLTNGVGYHVGKPKLKDVGQVMMMASTFPGKALLMVAEEENIVITPAEPQTVKNILEQKRPQNQQEIVFEGESEPGKKISF